MAKYFIDPFGVDGDRTTVPDAAQLDGSVSYDIGFGVDYELDPGSDPAALNIPRDKFNQLMFDITQAIQLLQQHGFPDFISSADNGGSPYSYDANATVRYNDVNYYSLVNSNTDTPPSTNWGVVEYNVQNFQPADVVETYDATLPSGWLWLDGKTIGSGSSGATGRANADTSNLFTTLWNSVPNAALPIQDSAGVATTRGANAAADFSANKRLPVPDRRGRVAACADNLGGTAANRLNGDTPQGVNGAGLGNSGGEQSHVLITSELAAHAHDFSANTNSAGLHEHLQGLGRGSSNDSPFIYQTSSEGTPGNATRSFDDANSTPPNKQGYTSISGLHNHSVSGTTSSTGSGAAHNNVQPTIVANFRIKL